MLLLEYTRSIILLLFALSISAQGDQTQHATSVRCNWQQPTFGKFVGSPSRISQVVPNEMLNDGYCDCPGGEDEYLTSACSGVALWAGSAADERDHEEDDGSDEHFLCRPEGVMLPYSNVNDGICDCCDGSDEVIDEYGSHDCPDTCIGILEKRRQEEANRDAKFQKGFAQRKNDIAAYEEVRLDVEAELKRISMKLEPLQRELVDMTEKLSEARAHEEEEQNQEFLRHILNIGSVLRLNTLNNSELEEIIVSACYLSGNSEGLQKAGNDLYQNAFSQLIGNAEEDYLMAEDEDFDEDLDEFDDEFDSSFDGNEYELEGIREDHLSSVQYANEEQINSAVIATSRAAFKSHAKDLLKDTNASNSSPSDSYVELARRLDQIKDAESAAANARKLISELVNGDEHVDLLKVSVLTLWYGDIGSANFYEILHSVLPEFKPTIPAPKGTSPENEMVNDASYCPPQSTVRMNDGTPVVIPPEFVTKAVDVRCKQRSGATVIGLTGRNSIVSMPTEIPADGYFGYFEFSKRSSDDEIVLLFMPIVEPKVKGKDVLSLEKEVAVVRKKVEDLEKEERDAKNRNIDNAELYAFRNHECVELDSTSYTYSICPGKKAVQYDIGASKGNQGTSLGTWDGFTRDETSGVLTMHFTRGLKCWNGPNRSASVKVACGDGSHKLLTATEPETCTYEFTMESTIACDDA